MVSFDYRLNPLYTIKEGSSCGALYTTDYCCSKGSLVDKIICDLNKTPDSSQRPPPSCAKCGNPVDGPYCRGCALLRKKFKEDLFTYCVENGIFQDLQDTSESSNDNTNVVNAPQEPFVVKQDPGENSSQSPPHIDHHCCYECGDSLDDIFCQQCTCKSCGKDAHYDGNSFTYGLQSNTSTGQCYNYGGKDIMLGIVPSQGMKEIEELSANICLMARIQPADQNSDDEPSYESAFISEVQSSSINENDEQFVEKIHMYDQCALETLLGMHMLKAAKTSKICSKVPTTKMTLTSQIEMYKERNRVLENITKDNNYLKEFLEVMMGKVCSPNCSMGLLTVVVKLMTGVLSLLRNFIEVHGTVRLEMTTLQLLQAIEDLDNLFGPMFEDYFEQKSSDTTINSAAQPTHDQEDSPSTSSIIVDTHEAPPVVTTSA
ncbi:hypothetical protein Tco_1437091 [Tanacetum coccineum]